MRILKRGKNPEDVLHQGTCNNCGTVVEFTRKEAKFHADQREGDFYSVICPVCSRGIYSYMSNQWRG